MFVFLFQTSVREKRKKGPITAVNPKDGDQIDISRSGDAVIVSLASRRD